MFACFRQETILLMCATMRARGYGVHTIVEVLDYARPRFVKLLLAEAEVTVRPSRPVYCCY